MSGAFNNYGQEAEMVDEDTPCDCGHSLYLHDDGTDACVICDCQKFKAAK